MGCIHSTKNRLFVVSSAQTKGTVMKITLGIVAAAVLVFMLAACGGGDDSGGVVATKPVKSIGPQLRPCEATGPTAPPCPASQSAGGTTL